MLSSIFNTCILRSVDQRIHFPALPPFGRRGHPAHLYRYLSTDFRVISSCIAHKQVSFDSSWILCKLRLSGAQLTFRSNICVCATNQAVCATNQALKYLCVGPTWISHLSVRNPVVSISALLCLHFWAAAVGCDCCSRHDAASQRDQ